MKKSKTKSVFLISFATFISRILGLIREQIFAFVLGASLYADAYLVAFRIPNLLRDLFAEGVFSSAFIPTFTDYLIKKGKRKSFELSNNVINLLSIVIIFLIFLGFIFSSEIVRIIAPGFYNLKEKYELTLIMTKILFPFLLFISLASIFMGMLNVYNIFFIPALAPALFNFVIIFGGIIIILLKPSDWVSSLLWAIFALLAVIAQFAIQIPPAYKIGFRYKIFINIKEEGIKKILKLILPATIGLAAVQINVIINTMIASLLPEGTIAHLNYAFRLIQLPIGLFGVSVATVNTAYIARNISEKNLVELKKNVADSLKLTSFLTIPIIFYFFFLGDTIVSIIFEYGRFKSSDTLNTFYALKYYAPAIFFYSGIKILAPIFYAAEKSYKAVIASISGVLANIIVNLTTYKFLGIKGIALGLSIGTITNFLILNINFINLFGLIKKERILISILKHTIASLGMLLIAKYLIFILSNYNKIFRNLFVLILSGIFYIIFCTILKVEESQKILEIIKLRVLKSQKARIGQGS